MEQLFPNNTYYLINKVSQSLPVTTNTKETIFEQVSKLQGIIFSEFF